MFKRLLASQEFIVFLTVIGLALLIGSINPVFFSIGNIFDLLRSATVEAIFALGVLIVIASGGIDVSFTAIAVFALYSTTMLLRKIGYDGPVLPIFALGALIGLVLGLINGLFIAMFKLPTLIATLGTQSLFRGFLIFVVGSNIIRDIPDSMFEFSKANLITFRDANDALVNLHSAVLIPIVFALLTWLLLRYTMLGRGIYAIGGAREAAERAGFNLRRIQFLIYAYVGVLSGIAGITYGSLNRQASPFDIVGSELDVIAAVVLGGALITGGRGTVIGTLLGVMLVVIINNSLILVGIPSAWQNVVIGAIIIIGTGVSALQTRNSGRRLTVGVGD